MSGFVNGKIVNDSSLSVDIKLDINNHTTDGYNGKSIVNVEFLSYKDGVEQVIGSWVDGKPIFRQAFQLEWNYGTTGDNAFWNDTIASPYSQKEIVLGNTFRIDNVIKFGGFFTSYFPTIPIRGNTLALHLLDHDSKLDELLPKILAPGSTFDDATDKLLLHYPTITLGNSTGTTEKINIQRGNLNLEQVSDPSNDVYQNITLGFPQIVKFSIIIEYTKM